MSTPANGGAAATDAAASAAPWTDICELSRALAIRLELNGRAKALAAAYGIPPPSAFRRFACSAAASSAMLGRFFAFHG